LPQEKLPAKKLERERKDLLKAIAEDRAAANSKAVKTPVAFQISDGEMRAAANTPGKAVYELTAKADAQVLTALRIQVLPLKPETTRHTPEDGFIVDKVEAWVIRPGGRQEKIAFRTFVADSETNLEAAVKRAVKATQGRTEGSGGFASEPNLFQNRWAIAIPTSPLQLSGGNRIKVQLTQTQSVSSKPALIRRARLAATGDARWSGLMQGRNFRGSLDQLTKLTRDLQKIPSVELPVTIEQLGYERRETLEFERGNFLNKTGPALTPDVPGLFPKLPAGAPRNRLTLATWFFSPQQPLTARTAVNRYWEQLFGTGIVETLENFGSVGEEPSHPELLDWLALHFENDLHWSMKALLREMVTSATYRQSAKSTPALTERDPRNRLLARGPQQRLTAEMVRDQALEASGLLSSTMGGPPVMPPQPQGVWNSVYNDSKWVDAKGPDRYRRAIYTYIKRTSGYPSFLTFDGSDHDTSLARRMPTNTPLQALVTLNDPVYQEASENLARRMMKSGDDLDGRLKYGARLVLSRDPTDHELLILRGLFEKAKAAGRREKPQTELAAMTAVASVLFNLDAALTR
jgi:hypothetical protein